MEWNNDLVGQENLSSPGRMNTSHEQEPASSTSRVYAHRTSAATRREVRMAWQMVYVTPSYLTKARPVMSTRGRREGWRSHVAICGGGLAGRRCNIDDSAVCFVGCCCSILIRGSSAACCLFMLRREQSAKTEVVLWALGRATAPHEHRKARPTHALHNAPRWRRLKPFA